MARRRECELSDTASESMVELHGGRLELNSAPGVGTRVTVRLPPERILLPTDSAAAAAA